MSHVDSESPVGQANLSSRAEEVIEFASSYPDEFRQIAQLVEQTISVRASERRSEDYTAELLNQYQLFVRSHSFREGQLVQWKPGLKNRRRPAYDEPVVVVNVLEESVVSTKSESSSTYFREPLDLILGFLDEDREFVTYYFDSRRMEPFPR